MHPAARELFSKAIQSNSFAQCPSPDDWLSFCSESQVSPVINSTLKQTTYAPYTPKADLIAMPPDPWTNMKGQKHNGIIAKPLRRSNSSVSRRDGHLAADNTFTISLPPLELPLVARTPEALKPDYNLLVKVIPVQDFAIKADELIRKHHTRFMGDLSLFDKTLSHEHDIKWIK